LNGLRIAHKKETGGRLTPAARKLLLIEERYAGGVALLCGSKMGLFVSTVMTEPVRKTKSLVTEIIAFCMGGKGASNVPKNLPNCTRLATVFVAGKLEAGGKVS
jgi:hypothetical protein